LVKFKSEKGKGVKGAFHKAKEWWAKMQAIKTESNFTANVGDNEEVEFIGCPTYTNIKTGHTTVDTANCKSVVKKQKEQVFTGVPQFSPNRQLRPQDFREINED